MDAAATFMQDSIRAYGYDKSRSLNTAIIEALSDSQSTIPLLRAVNGLKLMVSDKGMHAFADIEEGVIEISFDKGEDIDTIIDLVPFAIRHEVAHIAHYQHQPQLDDTGRPHEILWRAVVSEGVASHVEMALIPEYHSSGISPEGVYDTALVRKIEDGLIDVLYNPGDNQSARYYDFVMGDETFPMRGYEIGIYVVANYVEYSGADYTQLMKVTPDEFREFAETQL